MTSPFASSVALITSSGPNGDNIMTAAWTYRVSYNPNLIATCISFDRATHANIKKTKEFGVNICSVDDSKISSIAGGYSGKDHDKISALKCMGVKFYKGKKIRCLMISDSVMNAECKVIDSFKTGDHTIFIGEIVEYSETQKQPLVYYLGRYWKLEPVQKPSNKERQDMMSLVEKHKK